MLGGVPELLIERQRREGNAPPGPRVIGELHPDLQPPRREPSLSEPLPQRRSQPLQQRMQYGEVVGIGAQGMRQAILGFDLGGQDRPGIDAASLGAQQPSAASENGAQLALADDSHLPDPLKLIFIQPQPDIVGDFGQHAHQVRREERSLAAAGDE
jgi:hypothetical protein